MKTLVLTIACILVSQASFAGKCDIRIKRGACPGKEVETYKPYNGKVETEESKDFGSLDECKAWAEKTSKIVRKKTLADKEVWAKFDGADAGNYKSQGECN